MNREKEAEERAAVVAEAKKWLNTPYRDQMDMRGIGVDCVMLLVRCYNDTGALSIKDPRPYPTQWHLHQRTERYLAGLREYGAETTERKPGNAIVYKFGLCYSHGGILIDEQHMISSYIKDRIVAIQQLWQPDYVDRPCLIFDPWGAR